MERRAPKFRASWSQGQSDRAAQYVADAIKRAEQVKFDLDKVARLKAGLCKFCHYLASSLGGAAITTQACCICGEKQTYGSTNTDATCLPCAKKHALCKHCGGDSEMRPRRRKWPEGYSEPTAS